MAKKTTTKQQELEIVGLYETGLSKQSIEDKTGIGRQVVERVLIDWRVEMRSSGGVRPYNVKNDVFDDLSVEKSAYWLGFLFAELSIDKTNICLSLARKDEHHLELWKDFINCEKPIKRFNSMKYPVSRIDVSDRKLADRIRELGIEPHRARGVELLNNIPNKSVNHFLRGWFDGDGCAFLFPQLSFVGREPFLMEVQKIFIRESHANLVTLKKKNDSDIAKWLYYKGSHRCLEITNYLYKDATIWMPRKRDRILSWPEPKQAKSKRFWG